LLGRGASGVCFSMADCLCWSCSWPLCGFRVSLVSVFASLDPCAFPMLCVSADGRSYVRAQGPWKGHEYDGEWNMDRMEGKGQYTTAKNSGSFYISNASGGTPSKGPGASGVAPL